MPHRIQLDRSILNAELAQRLPNCKVLLYDEIDSTNIALKNQIDFNADEIFVVASKTQNKGHGRFNRPFFSPQGGLYFSFGWEYDKSYMNLSLITITAAVAIIQSLKELFNIEMDVKWVNDIIYKEKKLGGILTEFISNQENSKPDFLICGIGLNLLKSDVPFPEELQDTAIYLFDSTPKYFNYNEIIAVIMNQFFLLLKNPEKVLDIYRTKCTTIGKTVSFDYNGAKLSGVATGIEDDGSLQIQSTDNGVISLSSGEAIIIE